MSRNCWWRELGQAQQAERARDDYWKKAAVEQIAKIGGNKMDIPVVDKLPREWYDPNEDEECEKYLYYWTGDTFQALLNNEAQEENGNEN